MPSRHIIPQGVTQETRQQQTRYNYEDSQNRSTHESWATIAKDCSETWANTCQNLHPERMLRIGGMTQEMSVTEQSTSTEWMLPRSLWLWNSWGPAAWTTHWHTCEWQCQALDIRWLDHLLHPLETLISNEWMLSSFFMFSSISTWRNWSNKTHVALTAAQGLRVGICYPFQSKFWSTEPSLFHTPINLILFLTYHKRICKRNQLLFDLL